MSRTYHTFGEGSRVKVAGVADHPKVPDRKEGPSTGDHPL